MESKNFYYNLFEEGGKKEESSSIFSSKKIEPLPPLNFLLKPDIIPAKTELEKFLELRQKKYEPTIKFSPPISNIDYSSNIKNILNPEPPDFSTLILGSKLKQLPTPYNTEIFNHSISTPSKIPSLFSTPFLIDTNSTTSREIINPLFKSKSPNKSKKKRNSMISQLRDRIRDVSRGTSSDQNDFNLMQKMREASLNKEEYVEQPDKQQNKRIQELFNKNKKPTSHIDLDINYNPELSPTLLDAFSNSSELFIIYKDKLYTLSYLKKKSSQKGDSLFYKGHEFQLEESEELKTLEERFFENNKVNIEPYRKKILDDISKKNESFKSEISRIKSRIESGFNFSEYIVNEIFPTYYGEKKIRRKLSKNLEDDLSDESSESVKELDLSLGKTSNLESTLLNIFASKRREINGAIGMFGHFYGFSSSNGLKIDLDSVPKDFAYLCSFEELKKEYLEKINKHIKARILESITNQILKMKTREGKLNQSISQFSMQKTIQSRTYEELGFDKLDDNRYVIYKNVKPFLMQLNGSSYLFPGTKLGVTIVENNDTLKIVNLPGAYYGPGFIYQPRNKYKHPFTTPQIYDLGTELCFGKYNKNKNGIFDIKTEWQSFKDLNKNRFPQQIIEAIKQIEHVLTLGFRGSHAVPYKPLSNISFHEEFKTPEEAKTLARGGIKVYDNGPNS